eukprot:917109-Rhodomonas_salina.2
MRTLGSEAFSTKEQGKLTGLLNQGGTCYLNSLIQTLYMTSDFRSFVYRWHHNPSRHGPKENSIPAQLQSLLARLQLSSAQVSFPCPHLLFSASALPVRSPRFLSLQAASTVPLTASFGWTRAAAFQQHDVIPPFSPMSFSQAASHPPRKTFSSMT